MKSLIVLNGPIKSDKEKWVEEQGLSNFHVNIDYLKRLYYKPEMKGNREYLARSFDEAVYRRFIEVLNYRLGSGCLCVVDSEGEWYSLIEDLAKIYGYTVFWKCTEVPKKIQIDKSAPYKEPTKQALEEMLKFYREFDREGKNIIEQYEEVDRFWTGRRRNYRYIHPTDSLLFVSDVHSNIDKVNQLPTANNTVFLGDYVDGLVKGGSRKVVDELIKCTDNRKFWIEGNHELRLRRFLGYLMLKNKGRRLASEILYREINSDFLETTGKEFDDIKLPGKYLEDLNKKLIPYLILNYRGRKYLCSHSGLNDLSQICPKYIGTLISTNRNIDRQDREYSKRYNKENIVSVHGHCKYSDGVNVFKYRNVINLDTENETKLNYLYMDNETRKLCILE